MTVLSLRPRSAGEILDASFQLYRHHFAPLLLLGLIAFGPSGLLYAVAGVSATGVGVEPMSALAFLLFPIMMLVTAVVWAALIQQVEGAARGEPVRVGQGLGTGLRRFPAMILLGLLAYLLLLAAMVPIMIVAAAAGAVAALVEGAVAGVAMGLAVLAGLGWSVVALVWWGALVIVGPTVLVVERAGPLKALERARTLTRGGRVRVAGLGLVAWLIAFLPTMGLLVVLGLASTLWDPDAAATMSGTELLIQQFVLLGVSALTTPFLVAVLVVLYLDLRVKVEGYDVEMASAALAPGS